jgi:transposase InsO family protein
VIDDHPRFLVASVANGVLKAADVVGSLHGAAPARGSPASLLTDNGPVFTAVPRKGVCAIELETARLGDPLPARESLPPAPRQGRAPAPDAEEMAREAAEGSHDRRAPAELDRLRAYHNGVRPHRAIGWRTPAEVFGARPKAAPSLPGVPMSSHVRVLRDKIDITGVITLRHNSQLHHVGLGRRLGHGCWRSSMAFAYGSPPRTAS